MSQKAHRGSHPDGQSAGQAQASCASLPEAVLAHIAHLSQQHHGHSLLQVSRSCRDAVLSICTNIKLSYTRAATQQDTEIDARLLHRACCQARPGLQLKLYLSHDFGSLPQLLQPGIDCGGWRNVHTLQVGVCKAECELCATLECHIVTQLHIDGCCAQVSSAKTSAHLLGAAFPALTELDLFHVGVGDGSLFSMLAAQADCPLSSITVHDCSIKGTAVGVAATALAQLPSLRSCCVGGDDTSLRITQLTGLTRLEGALEAGVPPADTQLVKAVSRNTGLQSLTISPSTSESLSTEMLQCLLSSCTSLTQLDLLQHEVYDQGFDILLQHGNLTDLKLGEVGITRSRADRPCKWQRLWIGHKLTATVLDGLAHLPLRSVQELGTGLSAGTLHLPLTDRLHPSHRLPLLEKAVSNLVACPAWQKQPFTRVLLYTDAEGGTVAISDHEIPQLFEALSPLGGPHVQHLGISLNTEFGQQEVQALARSLGSTLRSLSIRKGVIKPSFWPALSQHLPHLKELGLAYRVKVDITGITAYLRTLTQPFSLYIDEGVLDHHVIADLTGSVDTWQLQGVSIKNQPPPDGRPDGDDFGWVDEFDEPEEFNGGEAEQETDQEGSDWEGLAQLADDDDVGRFYPHSPRHLHGLEELLEQFETSSQGDEEAAISEYPADMFDFHNMDGQEEMWEQQETESQSSEEVEGEGEEGEEEEGEEGEEELVQSE